MVVKIRARLPAACRTRVEGASCPVDLFLKLRMIWTITPRTSEVITNPQTKSCIQVPHLRYPREVEEGDRYCLEHGDIEEGHGGRQTQRESGLSSTVKTLSADRPPHTDAGSPPLVRTTPKTIAAPSIGSLGSCP
jgi:hypothetical protein